MHITSCDPGLHGAFVVFNEEGRAVAFYDMPLINDKKSKTIDLEKVRKILSTSDTLVIEKVHSSPRQGVSSAFNFGYTTGSIVGVAVGLGLHIRFVTPQRWKSYFGLIKKPKEAARVLAKKRYEKEVADWLNRKKDVDRADALLIGKSYVEIFEK